MTCSCGCNSCSGTTVATSGCGTASCSCSTDCCATTNVTGRPYYNCSSMCPEDNCQTLTITQTAGVFKTLRSFVMPACGATVQVTFESVIALPIGAWMWSGESGTFEIMGYDSTTGIVQLKNLCPESPCENTAAPGTTIPSCSIFVLSMPGCNESIYDPNSPFPYLAADFVAPNAPGFGNCTQIAVTNVNGLSVGHNVAIAGGTYRIDSIDSPVLITICNDGAGITPGTVVDHDDANGNLIVPIVLIDSNPCSATPVTQAAILGCNGGVVTPFTGLVAGQIPVLQDPVTGEAEYQSVGIPLAVCTILTICLTIDPAFPSGTSYAVTVNSTDGIEAGDYVQMGDPATIFYVDSIDGPTTMHLTPEPDPVVLTSFAEGTVVCLVDCCTAIGYQLADVFGVTNYQDAEPYAEYSEVLTVGQSSTSATCHLGFTNQAVHTDMGLHYVINAVWDYTLTGDATEVAAINHKLYVYAGTNPAGAPLLTYDLTKSYQMAITADYGSGDNEQCFTASFSGATSCNPGETIYVRAYTTITYVVGDIDEVEVINLSIRESGIGMTPVILPGP